MQTPQDIRDLPEATPLDEKVWQAWVLKGRAREARSYAKRVKAVKWLSLAGILCAAVAGLLPGLAGHQTPIRFLVMAGAMALMFEALDKRRYAFAAAFGGLALLYNPIAPVFSFSGDWQRVLTVGSALPFVASLTVYPKAAAE